MTCGEIGLVHGGRTSISKKTYSYFWFSRGAGPEPLTPSFGSADAHNKHLAPLSTRCASSFFMEETAIQQRVVRGDQDSRANLMPIYGDLYQIKV